MHRDFLTAMRLFCRPRCAIALAAMSWTPLFGQSPKVHELQATPATVAYGYYWADAKPVLRVASGDIIDVHTMITNRPDRLEAAGVPAGEIQQNLRDIMSQVTDRGPGGHILTGPVFVEGADSGDVLEVKILSVDLDIPYGYNGCSGYAKENCEKDSSPLTRIIRLDARRKVGLFAPGIEVPLHPFFGSMGVAPPRALGRVSSNPPHTHAGNLDNKELVAGTTLYIPIHAAGALFEVGDGHAAQGDGEVDQTAIETALRGKLQLTVRKDMHLDWPRAETPTSWITMGMDADLNVATKVAIQNMVGMLMEQQHLTRVEAYQLASIAADLRITQLVDGNVGVHMLFPKSLLRK
ncbi:MAG: acetamidase/formamidase family protein [Gemmatimonadaceae bacterium]